MSEIEALGAGVAGDAGGEFGFCGELDFRVECSEIAGVGNPEGNAFLFVPCGTGVVFQVVPDKAPIGILGQVEGDAIVLRILQEDLPGLDGHHSGGNAEVTGRAVF